MKMNGLIFSGRNHGWHVLGEVRDCLVERESIMIADPVALLQLAFDHLRAGRIAAADSAVRQLLLVHPEHHGVRNLAGLVALAQSDPSAAIAHLEQAIALQPSESIYRCNLGQAFRAAEKWESAEACYREALRLRPDYSLASVNLGSLLFSQKKWAIALETYDHALDHCRKDPLLWAHRGDVLRELGRTQRAIESYEHAIRLDPKHAHSLGNLGLMWLTLGQPEQGLEFSQRAAEVDQNSPQAQMNLGTILRYLERLEEAMAAYAKSYELAPQNAEICMLVGDTWQEVNELVEAHGWYTRALEIDPQHLRTRCSQIGLLRAAGDSTGAVEQFQSLLDEHPDCVEALVGLGEALWEEGEAEGAIKTLLHAVTLRPEAAGILTLLASVQASAGDVDQANETNEQALRVNPRLAGALTNLAMNLRAKLPREKVLTMTSLVQRENLGTAVRAGLHFGLAHYYDGCGDYTQAAEHAVTANQLHTAYKEPRGWKYDPDEYTREIDEVIATFNAAHFTRCQGAGLETEVPVFIVGMPRSGTTLTEQILASHPNVYGVGERNFAIRSFQALPIHVGRPLSPIQSVGYADAQNLRSLGNWHLDQLKSLVLKGTGGAGQIERIVDKMPDNYSQVGWITTMFPNARIIHCRRDVRDVAVSCWMTPFRELRWAFDLKYLARRILDYERVMEHWRNVLPRPMLEIDYEQTVRDPEGQTRRMLAFIGQPFDAACLAFHETERLVRTASVTQVRQPMYTRSVERWRRYESALQPLLEILQEASPQRSVPTPAASHVDRQN